MREGEGKRLEVACTGENICGQGVVNVIVWYRQRFEIIERGGSFQDGFGNGIMCSREAGQGRRGCECFEAGEIRLEVIALDEREFGQLRCCLRVRRLFSGDRLESAFGELDFAKVLHIGYRVEKGRIDGHANQRDRGHVRELVDSG